MNKFLSIYTYMEEEMSTSRLFNVWNAYCEQKFPNGKIYVNDSKNILALFPSSAYLADVLTYPSKYDRKDNYFTFVGKRLYSFNDINGNSSPVSLECLAEWLIDNGDTGLDLFDLDDYLEDEFINEYFGDMADDAKEIIDEVSKDEPIDFLMEDWNDIAANIYLDVIVTNVNKR